MNHLIRLAKPLSGDVERLILKSITTRQDGSTTETVTS